MAETDAIYQAYVTYEEDTKSGLIELRDEQKAAVKAAKDYFEKSNENQRFLWNAKMRFGKTFCAMELAIEMGESEIDPKGKKDSKPISRVLILTHRPVVQDGFAKDLRKLQDSLKAKGQLKREWGFGTRFDNDDFDNFDDLERDAKTQNKPFVFFSSTQWLCYSKEVGGNIEDPLRKSILNNKWDLVVIDEAHEGILADRGSEVIEKLQKVNPKMLYMSGTPFNLLEGSKGFSEDQIYSWDYIEEQKMKLEWPKNNPGKTNPYQELPKMNIFAFNMGTLIPGQDYRKGDMFSFTEMFRTFVGRPEVDIVDGKPYKASKEEIGKFVHEEDVLKFLDLMYLGNEETNYPYTKEQYQENFRHTLWIVPGVKEAKALKALMEEKHNLFGSEDFRIINVAGNSEADENLDDLGRVTDAIKTCPYTITLSCGKLTTGVTVPEWTAVFYMKGSADSSTSTYMQTIFRVQSPHVYEKDGEKRMKANCYVFDFAPGRSLKVVAETAKFSRKTKTKKNKTNIITQKDEEIIADFTTYCPIWQPVVAKEGSSLQPISTDEIISELNKVYVENIVKNGFDDYNIYLDEEILKLTDDVIQETKDIVNNIPGDNTKDTKKDSTQMSDDGGLTTTTTKARTPKQKQTEKEKWQKEVDAGKTTEDFDTWLARKDKEAEEEEKLKNNRKLIHAITKRIPLLMFGAEVDDEEIGINIDNITERIDDDSWNEFMPKGATKAYFKKIKHCYNDSMFRKAGTMIRDWARETDDMHIEERIARIAKIFTYFKNPDKETVLTPWRVVNMHMSNTLGGYSFYDESFQNLNKVSVPVRDENGVIVKDVNGKDKIEEKELPRLVGEDTQVYKDIFGNIDLENGESKTKVLEINSKTGLYPLYVAYSLYKPLMALYMEKHMVDNPDMLAVSEERAIWNTIIKNNIYVICNTDMAVRITYRTLAGYNPIDDVDTSTIAKQHYIKGMHVVSDKLIEKVIEDKDALIKTIKSQGYWEHSDNSNVMKFDAIVGNPPYQLAGAAGGNNDAPIYQHFAMLASDVSSKYVSMILKANWTSSTGGRENLLQSYRTHMLQGKHLKKLFVISDSSTVFNGVEIKGGVCYYLEDNSVDITEFLYYPEHVMEPEIRKINNRDTFIRNKEQNSIVEKVEEYYSKQHEGETDYCFTNETLYTLISNDTPFGIPSNPKTSKKTPFNVYDTCNPSHDVLLYHIEKQKRKSYEYVALNDLKKNTQDIDKIKVFIPGAAGSGRDSKVLGKPELAQSHSVCSQSYLYVEFGTGKDHEDIVKAKNFIKYLHTKFVRVLVAAVKISQACPNRCYQFVPIQDFSSKGDIDWTKTIDEIDDYLFDKYHFTKDDITYTKETISKL